MSINNTFTEAMRIRRVLALFFGLAFALLLVLGLHSAEPAEAATQTFTVNSTGDENDLDFTGGTFDGSSDGRCDVNPTAARRCTLRAAIQAANKRRGADTIKFNIPLSGVQTISPASALPKITRRVTIDGYTQPGSKKNTIPLATNGTDANLMIELRWPGTTPRPVGLELSGARASNSVIRGLVINDFDQGIKLNGGTGYKIEGNFIGTDPSGKLDVGNRSAGVSVFASDSTIGGTSPAARNLISGNGAVGIQASGVVGFKIQGNLIGTSKDGTGDLSNGSGIITGPGFTSSKNNLIGGTNPAAANTIAFNDVEGIKIDSGGTGLVNIGTRILSNSIFSNTTTAGNNLGLGINLSGGTQNHFGVTGNDLLDSDTGPNRLQNYPVINSAQVFPNPLSGTTATIGGTLNSTPSTAKVKRTFIIQFFSSPEKDPSDYGEGKTLVGQTEVTTDRDGNASFSVSSTRPVSAGEFITATATNKTTGDTSEFSKAVEATEPVAGG